MTNQKLKSTAVITVLALLGSGCATILNEDYQKITVATSNNKEAKGSIDGVPFTAPTVVSVKRAQQDKIMMVESPGCQKQTVLNSNVDNKFFINILSGGTFGSSTDYGTEKMWKYQDSITINCN